MKKVIFIVILVVLSAVVGYTLLRNKGQLEQAAALARQEITEFPVRIITVSPGIYTESMQLSGKLFADEELMVMPAVQGRVSEIIVEKGDWVNKGDLLARIEDKLYRTEYNAAEKAYQQALANSKKFDELAESDAVTGQQQEMMALQLEGARAKYIAAREQLAETRIVAPISGYVNQVFSKSGSFAGPGNPMFELVNNKELLLKISAGESEVSNINTGDSVEVRIPVSEREILPGQVTFVAIKPDYSGMYPVEISVKNPGDIKAGLLAEAVFSESVPNSLVIPSDAVTRNGDQLHVFLASDGKAIRREIQVNRSNAKHYLVEAGLAAGDQVIVEGNNRISDQSSIRVVN